MPCCQCNKIVCKNCFGTKYRGESWESASSQRPNWNCPSCSGLCSCPRCKKVKPKLSYEDFKPNKRQMERSYDDKLSSLLLADPESYSPDLKEEDLMDSEDDSILEEDDKDMNSDMSTSPPPSKVSVVYQPTKLAKKGSQSYQLDELKEREKRADTNIKEMERLMSIMQKEKDMVTAERKQLEMLLEESDNV